MRYKISNELKKILKEKLNIDYDNYIIFLKSTIYDVNIYVLFDKEHTKFLKLKVYIPQERITVIGKCEGFSTLGIKGISENNYEMSAFNFVLSDEESIKNSGEDYYMFLKDKYKIIDKETFKIDHGTEIYFKMGGEIDLIKIFNE